MEGYALSLNVEPPYKYSWGDMSVWDDGYLRGLSPTASSLSTDGRERCLGSLEREILPAELETQTAPSGGLQEHLWGF